LEVPDLKPVALDLTPAQPLQIVGLSNGQAGLAGATVPSMGGLDSTGILPIVSHDVHLIANKTTPAWKKAALAGVAVLLLVGVYFVIDPDAMSEVLAMLGMGTEEVAVAPVHQKEKAVVADPPATTKTESVDAPAANIWESIDNDYGAKLAEVSAPLTADQEAQFQAGLDSELTYQRYKTILDIAMTRARGTEDMLRQGLESKKFWTRMRAVIALAEMGEPITDDDMKLALGDAHSELRARFFKRFEKSPCGTGCYFIARAALPHLDARGREQVIRVVSREDSEIRDVFMVAATFDESDIVKKAAAEWLDRHSVKSAIWQDVKAITGH
jgi:hypothetical protein